LVKTAQRIVRRVETILSPIESAIEDVDIRTDKMNEMVESAHTQAKTLTGLLAGSVATQVHGGVKEICQAFLASKSKEEEKTESKTSPSSSSSPPTASSPKSPKPGTPKIPLPPLPTLPTAKTEEKEKEKTFDPQLQSLLRKSIHKFLMACQKGLDLNKTKFSTTDTEKEFQANLDTQFDELCSAIQTLIAEPKAKKQPKTTKTKGGGVRFG